MHELWTYMAQRDDAETEAEKNYWIGYIDAIADIEDYDVAEAEAGYQLMQVEAASQLERIAKDAEQRER